MSKSILQSDKAPSPCSLPPLQVPGRPGHWAGPQQHLNVSLRIPPTPTPNPNTATRAVSPHQLSQDTGCPTELSWGHSCLFLQLHFFPLLPPLSPSASPGCCEPMHMPLLYSFTTAFLSLRHSPLMSISGLKSPRKPSQALCSHPQGL